MEASSRNKLYIKNKKWKFLRRIREKLNLTIIKLRKTLNVPFKLKCTTFCIDIFRYIGSMEGNVDGKNAEEEEGAKCYRY